MSGEHTMQDPLEFMKNLWGQMGFALPGMVAPTLDVGELEKRITDLKAVEGWLKMNLNMLQTTIQGLEVQRATLAAMQAMGESARAAAAAAANARAEEAAAPAASGEAAANPFNPATLWPWNLVQASKPAEAAPETPPAEPPRKGRARKSADKQ
ncbi:MULTISPECIES: PhaM family polyhydroxyalkanoate granule multifunctional regulatory protein [Niveibacterium]|uniref:Transcriptional regulator n=1 Tax=Niveibacterium microcysteis TaxID=2811415 RepID=A0ABX7M7E9_9RHOO|nr:MULTISPECIES: PhaM family polyhydroxyalkanoate granule multifunctional regulatory protein [Niveibacterium]QSI77685.1 hypothetical protein JY500_03240 [Niveibacterium microcysteis]